MVYTPAAGTAPSNGETDPRQAPGWKGAVFLQTDTVTAYDTKAFIAKAQCAYAGPAETPDDGGRT